MQLLSIAVKSTALVFLFITSLLVNADLYTIDIGTNARYQDVTFIDISKRYRSTSGYWIFHAHVMV